MAKKDLDILSLWGHIKGFYYETNPETQKHLFPFVRHIYSVIHDSRSWNLAIKNRELHKERSKERELWLKERKALLLECDDLSHDVAVLQKRLKGAEEIIEKYKSDISTDNVLSKNTGFKRYGIKSMNSWFNFYTNASQEQYDELLPQALEFIRNSVKKKTIKTSTLKSMVTAFFRKHGFDAKT